MYNRYVFKKMLMVNQEVVNNPKKKAGLFAALKTMFTSDEERVDANVQAEVDKLNAESEKSIKAIQDSILGKKQEREELSKKLKPEKIEPLKNGSTKKVKEQDEREI